MEKFFSVFGKVMLVILVLGTMSYGGYYFGKQTEKTKEIGIKKEEIVTSPSPLATNSQQLVTVIAGLPKSAGLSFDQYSVMTPADWTSKKESQTATDEKLILTKDGYSISILQAATGGALCLYPGDAEFEGPSSKYAQFTNLTTKDDRILRRSGDLNGTAFTVCQKSVDNSYIQPTNYGHISVKLPEAWTQEVLTEIDEIISSLKKI